RAREGGEGSGVDRRHRADRRHAERHVPGRHAPLRGRAVRALRPDRARARHRDQVSGQIRPPGPGSAPPALRGADALVATLAEAGVPQIFTLSGNHVMSVFDATIGRGVELIHTRHEAATVHMADAWARLTGQVGVALVTGGPGHANAISALY